MKRIAVMTSGGDAPGMNACIRAIVRSGIKQGLAVYGIYNGYEGLIGNQLEKLTATAVSGVLQHGGTFLKSSRSEEFLSMEGREKGARNLRDKGIENLIAIGGDGTFRGGKALASETDIAFIGIPGTIDNDLYGTDSTIGYDSALNTVVEAVDRIRDTASAHDRLFFIEVMGRDAGFIALRSGIAVGAEAILVPEERTDIEQLSKKLRDHWKKNRTSSLIIVAEGTHEGGAYEIAQKVKAHFPEQDSRVSVLGHIQRGGSPTARDRILASSLGDDAVKAVCAGKKNIMTGVRNGNIAHTTIEKAVKHNKRVKRELMDLVETLSI